MLRVLNFTFLAATFSARQHKHDSFLNYYLLFLQHVMLFTKPLTDNGVKVFDKFNAFDLSLGNILALSLMCLLAVFSLVFFVVSTFAAPETTMTNRMFPDYFLRVRTKSVIAKKTIIDSNGVPGRGRAKHKPYPVTR